MYEDEDTWVCLSHEPLSVSEAFEFVRSNASGAVASFIGTTRDNFDGKKVTSLEYEAYAEMATEEMTNIIAQMRQKWALNRVYMTHKLGPCPVGDVSIIIFVSSAHRGDALQASEYAINTLKATVPIWKKVSCHCILFSKNSPPSVAFNNNLHNLTKICILYNRFLTGVLRRWIRCGMESKRDSA